MAKKVKIPDLKFEDLKTGQVYRSKNPKMIGFFRDLVDDRQILHITSYKHNIGYVDHGYTPEFEEWCNKPGAYRHNYSSIDQEDFEEKTGLNSKNIESITDYIIQYDSPSVKNGKNYPKVPASKFIKWAAENITEKMPKGEWASSF